MCRTDAWLLGVGRPMSTSDDPPAQPDAPRAATERPVRWFGKLGQVDFEIDFFEQILAHDPKYVVVLRSLGELLACKGRYDRSLEIDQRLVALVPQDGVARYNLACSLA